VNAFIWILQIVLAGMFLMAGAMKVMKTKDDLLEQMAWVEDFDGTHITTIGGLEILAAIGLVLPGAFNVLPGVTPWAALGIAALMIGAAITHIRRGEVVPYAVTNIGLGVMAAIVAWGRFGDYAF